MKDFKKLYKLPDLSLWQGRQDAGLEEYVYQIIQPLDLSQPELALNANSPLVLLSFACDIGIKRNLGRPGAAEGPSVIKQALGRLPVQKTLNLYDAGIIEAQNDELESAQAVLATAVEKILAMSGFPIILGGGHETAWGHYQGLTQHYKQSIPILNFDAHFDLRDLPKPNYGTSGTPFQQIALLSQTAQTPFNYNCVGIQNAGNTKQLFERAAEYDVKFLRAEEIYAQPSTVLTFINDLLQRIEHLYVTLCLDVLDSAHAPGVSAPQPLGLQPWHILPSLIRLAESGKLVSLDIVEYAPCYDIDSHTARLAAQLIHHFLHCFHQEKKHEASFSP